MQSDDPLERAGTIAQSIEELADMLRPEVIRAARADANGRRDLDRIEYALGTIGKALILTDYSIDQEKDIDKLNKKNLRIATHILTGHAVLNYHLFIERFTNI